MDYEKKYRETLERAYIAYKDEDKHLKATLERIFPELCMSEDEKIKKELIDFVKSRLAGFPKCDRFINWLERQGEQNPQSFLTPKSALEAWKAMRFEVYQQASGNRHEPNCSDDTTKMFSLNDIDEIFEKICEQKTSDKVEPKFKVGDWIANNYCVGKVIALTDDAYLLDTGQGIPFSCEDNVHLWTIEDAKNGDVLSNGKMIVIFKHLDEPSYKQHIVAHIGLDIIGNIQITDDFWCLGIDKTKTATKEQRDTLMKAMADAGYTFDFAKKELKKIEQKNAWSEKDKILMYNTLSNLIELKDRYGEGYGKVGECIDWLKSLKEKIGG